MSLDLHRQTDLCVLTAYFNPESYSSRARNYARFIAAIREQGVPCITVECAFGDRPFELPDAPGIIRRRTSSVLWQKERLLNVALAHLPGWTRKVAWVDADVLFENPSWYRDASRLLDEFSVIQLFDLVIRLPHGHDWYMGEGVESRAFGAEYRASPGCERLGWYHHGHTGFAWAARREVLEACGFFDLCLTGSGDHLMSHGFVGDSDSRCIDLLIGLGSPLHTAFAEWTRAACRASGRRVSFLPGRILHLWHGDIKDRKYHERSQQFKTLGFSPSQDIRLCKQGCWSWTGRNLALETWARELYADRKEDG